MKPISDISTMKKPLLLTLLAILLLQACNSDSSTTSNADTYVPYFVLKDSLVIDHLGPLGILDYHKPSNSFLMFNRQKNDLLIVSGDGNVLVEANRSEPGPDSYKIGNFLRAQFSAIGNVVVNTGKQEYIYNRDLKLIENREVTVNQYSVVFGGSNSYQILEDYTFLFGLFDDEREGLSSEELKAQLWELPLLKIFDHTTNELVSEANLPKNTTMRKAPGDYTNVAPYIVVKDNKAYFLYIISPEIYITSWPELELLDTVALNPELEFTQMKPATNNPIERFFEMVIGSSFGSMHLSGDYIVTRYSSGVSRNEVDKLSREVIGGEDFMNLQRSKFYVYQIFKGKEKIWEGRRDFNISFLDDLAYATVKPGEEYTEKDQTVFYFYSLE